MAVGHSGLLGTGTSCLSLATDWGNKEQVCEEKQPKRGEGDQQSLQNWFTA